jgi:DNA-binding protein HU-beta
MNKQQLTEAVAKTLGEKAAPAAVEAVFDAITRELADGGEVLVVGFGTFLSTRTAPRPARNPRNGDLVHIPARTRPKFRPGQNLLDLVNGDRPVPKDGSAIRKASKGTRTVAPPVDARAARLEADRKAAAAVIAGRRVAGQAGAR